MESATSVSARAVRSLFVFDAGDWTIAGCTSDEIEQLLEVPGTRERAVIYRIHRAYPDGRMELQGVSRERFELESGLFFHRADESEARADFATLIRLSEAAPPPCRCFVQLARAAAAADNTGWLTALVYPAECEEEVSSWLSALDYAGGAFVEGGISAATGFYRDQSAILDRRQLWPRRESVRPVDELLSLRRLKSAG